MAYKNKTLENEKDIIHQTDYQKNIRTFSLKQ